MTQHTAHLLLRLRNRHFFLVDLLLCLFIPFVAIALRTDDVFEGRYVVPLAIYTLLSLPLWLGVFVWCGLYTRNWQYASIDELSTILRAVIIGSALNIGLFFWILRPLGLVEQDFPRSIPFLVGILAVIAVGGTRYSVRFMDRVRRKRQFAGHAYKQVIVYGAGSAGALIVRELQANPQLGLNPVAFLDDDRNKHHTVIYGVPVIGGRASLASVVRDYHAEQIIIAMPTASGKLIREITAECLQNQLEVKTVPGMYELLDGSVTASKLRNVDIDDLLRRAPVQTESEAVVELLRGKRVLVTGAGGSIGGELCRQIARCAPAQLILLGHGENSLFNQTNELVAAHPSVQFESVLADVRDARRMMTVMARFRPHIVFHAAAHKHVPLMEANVEEAVSNNVLGTCNVLDAAMAHDVKTFVMISSDKAVNPVSVMGATKRVAELYVHARALQSGRAYSAVRFGNVLGSRGSVVPLFKQQIANGGPVKVTHPDVRRYFMTIPEAVQLVLQAATLGKGGEIFALDMGEPVRIVDLAKDLIRLSGLKVGQDIDIEFTGLRPGEKLYEELFIPGEVYERTSREKIYVARNGFKPPEAMHARLYEAIDQLIDAAEASDADAVRERLTEIVPEFGTTHEARTITKVG
ncbi:MAG TPA: nucleoside-diphosphate sugar epimerase/dehydratase [Anaerolineae bacterium]|nr:nucleoside-diphosphate sugar epimerase/dehydratase [Anaerolineae bacterium]